MKKSQSGQALVLVLLTLAVVLTIVLFILARSVTDIAVSSRSQDAVRAFSAAEAGIEQALVIGVGTGSTPAPIGTAHFTSSVADAGLASSFIYPPPMSSGDSMIVWFQSHDSNGNLVCNESANPPQPCFGGTSMTVCWGSGTGLANASSPAIEVSVFYKTGSGVTQIGRATADPYSGRPAPNNLDGLVASSTSCPSGPVYQFKTKVDFSGVSSIVPAGGKLLFARIRMLYNTTSQPLGVAVVGDTLPSQGSNIVSTGTAGNSNRKVAVFQGWPAPPSVFDYAIYGGPGNGLEK